MSNPCVCLASLKYCTAKALLREPRRDRRQHLVSLQSRGSSRTARGFIFNCLTQCSSDDWDHLAADQARSVGEAGMAKGKRMAGKGGGILRVVPRRLCLLPMWKRVRGSHPLDVSAGQAGNSRRMAAFCHLET